LAARGGKAHGKGQTHHSDRAATENGNISKDVARHSDLKVSKNVIIFLGQSCEL